MQNRIGSCKRKTKETDIELTINLDGQGKNQIDTGIPFFDHMLDGFARHGLFDSSGILKFRKGLCECEYSEMKITTSISRVFFMCLSILFVIVFSINNVCISAIKLTQNIDNAKIKGQ